MYEALRPQRFGILLQELKPDPLHSGIIHRKCSRHKIMCSVIQVMVSVQFQISHLKIVGSSHSKAYHSHSHTAYTSTDYSNITMVANSHQLMGNSYSYTTISIFVFCLVYAFAFGSISILGVTVLCNIVLVLKMSALLHSQIVQSPLIWLAPGVSSDHKRRDKSQRWISSEDTNISNERIYYISQA